MSLTFEWRVSGAWQSSAALAEVVVPDADHALCGPYGDPERVHIEKADCAPLQLILLRVLGDGLTVGREAILETPEASLAIREVVNPDTGDRVGLAATDPARSGISIVQALLWGGHFAVAREMRGRGIGRGLIAAEMLRTGRLPFWREPEPRYSPEGAKTVRSGLRLFRELAPICSTTNPEKTEEVMP